MGGKQTEISNVDARDGGDTIAESAEEGRKRREERRGDMRPSIAPQGARESLVLPRNPSIEGQEGPRREGGGSEAAAASPAPTHRRFQPWPVAR